MRVVEEERTRSGNLLGDLGKCISREEGQGKGGEGTGRGVVAKR